MCVKHNEPFLVRVHATDKGRAVRGQWVIWDKFSSDAILIAMELLDLGEAMLRISSRPATVDECINNKALTRENAVLEAA